MNKLETLKNILDGSIRYEFLEGDATGDRYLKISNYYNGESIYINFYYIMQWLEIYTGINNVLLTDEEFEKNEGNE